MRDADGARPCETVRVSPPIGGSAPFRLIPIRLITLYWRK